MRDVLLINSTCRESSWYFSGSTLIGVEESIRRLNEDEVFILKTNLSARRSVSFLFRAKTRKQLLLVRSPRLRRQSATAQLHPVLIKRQRLHQEQFTHSLPLSLVSQDAVFAAMRATCRSVPDVFSPEDKTNSLTPERPGKVFLTDSGRTGRETGGRNYLSRCACFCCGRS